MKKMVILSLLGILLVGSICWADNLPVRYATEVKDVFEPYQVKEMIVSPDEEPAGDQTSSQVLESDIRGIIACYDQDYLRVDILLHNSVSFQWDNFYQIKFIYVDLIEYYTFYPDTEELVYTQEENGEIVKRQVLDSKQSDDRVGITDSGPLKNGSIYFIINKKQHLTGEKGKTYFLTTSFLSGYVNTKNELAISDQTMDVDLYFVM